jgi:hypothetical protein
MPGMPKWRRWIKTIDEVIFDSIREDKVIFDGYYALVESNTAISSPWNFHQWALGNHGRSLMLQVRKLVDSDRRAYSLKKLLGEISNSSGTITRRSFIAAYPRHHRDIAEINWAKYTGGANVDRLPKSVPLRDIDLLKCLSDRIRTLVDRDIAHLDRRRRRRKTNFDEIYDVLQGLVSIAAKYGDLLGRPVADDLNNFVITYDWMSVFDVPWRKNSSNKTLQGTRSKQRASGVKPR